MDTTVPQQNHIEYAPHRTSAKREETTVHPHTVHTQRERTQTAHTLFTKVYLVDV
jgi:hypothetical protein